MKCKPTAPCKRTSSRRPEFTLHARDFCIPLGKRTRIMGIINMTPDSFSGDGLLKKRKGRFAKDIVARAVALAEDMVANGADFIDIGGESTRPESAPVTADEEIKRVIPVISALSRRMRVPISIDTYKPLVARAALDAGASIVNTIKGVNVGEPLLKMVQRYKAAIVLMHIRGSPRTMQRRIPLTRDIVKDIAAALKISMEKCLEIGIKSDNMIVDPGIGFGKTVGQNLIILDRLDELASLRRPILVGTSRKSFIGKLLGNTEPGQREEGTLASICLAISNGAHIVRVHDVRSAVRAATITDAIINATA